jgi:phosphatidylglycerophosphatase A
MRKRSTVIRSKVSDWFATCSYVGYLPLAPGTWGSVLACVILYIFPQSGNPVVLVFLVVAGIVTAERARAGEEDPGRIVIDEYVGMVMTMVGHNLTIWNLVEGFILFRAFDILKPYPIRKLERLPGGYGIVADDLLAGVFASIVLFLVGRLLG